MEIFEGKALVVPPEAVRLLNSSVQYKLAPSGYGVVRWKFDECVALAGLGFHDTPSPILRDYAWSGKHTPFEHQKTTASFLSVRKRAFCFSEPGTGKTASVIWAADYLMHERRIKHVLVLCPLSTMQAVWQQDLFKFAMHRSCGIAYGDPKARVKVIKSDVEFVIMNFDGLGIVEKEVIAARFDLIVVDEATAYKNAGSARWKALNRVVNATDPRLWMLTGTPAAQSPLDAYGLAKLVNPQNTPRNITQYKDIVMQRLSQFLWVPKPQAKDIVHTLLQPAIRFEKAQCLDLPEVIHSDREAALTAQQQKFYNLLKNKLTLSVSNERVTAVNAASALTKLLQIAGGSVYSDTGEVIDFDVSNRINTVMEVINETTNKTLVFVPFTHTIDLLKESLEKQGVSVGVIDGRVSANARGQLVQDFQNKPDPHVMIIQPQAAAHGITLAAADTVVWYAPVTSVETYLQANARIDRPGQKHTMSVVHIYGSPVEKRLYAMLKAKLNSHAAIVALYKEEFED